MSHSRSKKVSQTDNDCSTDDNVIKCCSLKTITGILPDLVVRNGSKINYQEIMTMSNGKPFKNNKIDVKKCELKSDEQMYDLAHLLFKISDLFLKITEYEKKNSVVEKDLRKMLNLLKNEIMKSFLNGKTSYGAMNKLVGRLKYLDDSVKGLLGKSSAQNTKHERVKDNKKLKGLIEESKLICEDDKCDCSNKQITEMTEVDYTLNYVVVEEGTDKKLLEDSDNKNSRNKRNNCKCNKKIKPNVNLDPNISPNDTSSTKVDVGSQEFLKLTENSTQTDDTFRKIESGTMPMLKTCSATTSFDEFYFNSNKPLPDIEPNLVWTNRHKPKLNPNQWIEMDGKMEMIELPVNHLDKIISAQKLENNGLYNWKIHAEGNVQTDEIMLTENADYQIVSMNVLYSKTHLRYILPDWMDAEYNLDESPRLLCKQDLNDGVALTSYKADSDGTIHFTLAFSSEELSNRISQDLQTSQLISKLQEIRGIWAESARILYETLIKDYQEQSISIEHPHVDPLITRREEKSTAPENESSLYNI